MSAPIIQIPATLDGASRRKDKSVSVRIVSNFEMSTADFAKIDEQLGTAGWMLWSPNELQPEDIPELPADEAFGQMTPSQELRWWLKKLHEQNTGDIEWPDYYRSTMRKFVEQVKTRVER